MTYTPPPIHSTSRERRATSTPCNAMSITCSNSCRRKEWVDAAAAVAGGGAAAGGAADVAAAGGGGAAAGDDDDAGGGAAAGDDDDAGGVEWEVLGASAWRARARARPNTSTATRGSTCRFAIDRLWKGFIWVGVRVKSGTY